MVSQAEFIFKGYHSLVPGIIAMPIATESRNTNIVKEINTRITVSQRLAVLVLLLPDSEVIHL